MKIRPMTVRRGAALCAMLLLASACGSDGKAATTPAPATTASASATNASTPDATTANSVTDTSTEATDAADDSSTEAFPVSIPNQFGTTEIPAKPERVVSIGFTDGDDVLALGVQPVAIRDWYGSQPNGIWPWATAAAAGANITMLESSDLDLEAIAALQPDLIIGISAALTQTDYDKLTKIAPTVAAAADSIQFGTPWDEQQLIIGTALGLETQAQTLVDDVNADIEAAVAANPSWKGLTGNVAAVSPDGSSFLYTPSDARGRLLTDLGFVIPDQVTTLAGDLFYAQASAEQSSLLEGDILLYTTFSAADRAGVDANPLFSGLGVVEAGHSIYMDDVVNGAMSFSTTLSIPAALQALVPQIGAALGDTATADTAVTTDTTDTFNPSANAGGIVTGADPEVDGVVAAYTTVFDSATTYAEKAPFLPDAATLKTTVDGYATAGEAVGGIKLVPTAVTIDGDTATVTYDVQFAGTVVYNALTGSAVKVDGAWTITRAEFCGFMSSARNPCP